MATWNQRLKAILDERGINRAAVSRKLHMNRNRLLQMEAGHEPRVTDAIKIAEFLGMAVEDLFGKGGRTAVPRKAAASRSGLRAFSVRRGRWQRDASLKAVGTATVIEPEDVRDRKGLIPVLAPIAAGEPREAHDKGYPAGAADAYVAFETDDPNAFGLVVDGSSMLPDFRHGDIIIASPKLGQDNTTFRDGMLAVVIYHGERIATFKRVRFEALRDGMEVLNYTLESINPAFPPMRLKTREIAAIYPVIGLIRREE